MKTKFDRNHSANRSHSRFLTVAAIVLATCAGAEAAAPTAQILSPQCPVWAEVSKPVEFIVAGIDPDNDLSRCDRYLDGALVETKYFSSATSGSTLAWNVTFGSPGTHTLSFQVVDKGNHFSPGNRCTVEVTVPAQTANLRVLTYNTHLFEDSPLTCLCICGEVANPPKCTNANYVYYDEVRRNKCVELVRASGADIVALQEVWAYAFGREWMAGVLATGSPNYPYAYRYDSSINAKDAMWASAGNAAMQLLLKTCMWEESLHELPNPADRERINHTLGNGLLLLSKYPLSDWRFERFPTYETCGPGGCETWSDKGILTANVNVRGMQLRVGVTHALTGPDDEKGNWEKNYVADGMTTFTLKDEAFIFALENNNKGHISRFEDYSYFDFESGTTKHGAGWKHVYTNAMNSSCLAVSAFELRGHPFLFSLHAGNIANISRINDDPATGWTVICSNWPLAADYELVKPFALGGHPYILGVHRGSNIASILRVNDEPSTGLSSVHTNSFGSRVLAVEPFEMDGRSYVFMLHGDKQGAIYQLQTDGKGWSRIHSSLWGTNYVALTSFRLGGHPYIFGLTDTNKAHIERINDNPATGWTPQGTNTWTSDYLAVKVFELNAHPYLFALRNCCGGQMDSTWVRPRPGEAYLKRINDDGRGWENLWQLEDIRMIRDATVVDKDGPPAIMMGDFNIHRSKYGVMNELFHKAGAVDAYVAVHGSGTGGETIDWFNNSTYRYFWPNASPTSPDVLDRIDYVYVKPSGGGLSLTPTNAFVIRNWKLEPNHEDVSDHYPVVVDFRLQPEPKLAVNRVAAGSWQLSCSGVLGWRAQVQSSADLSTWSTIAEFRLTNSPHLYMDPRPEANSSRFYRMRVY